MGRPGWSFHLQPPWVCIKTKHDSHVIILDAEGDKGGWLLDLLAGLSDAEACDTNSCSSRTAPHV